MAVANQRKKNPEQVRTALLDNAALLSVQVGLHNISLQDVAKKSGVTKGGLLHHFPSKRHLIDAVFDDMMRQVDEEIDAYLKKDSGWGCFTRAYISMTFSCCSQQSEHSDALALSILTDSVLCSRWVAWLLGRIQNHAATDDDPSLEVIRLAADGLWLAMVTGTIKDYASICEKLIASTRKKRR